jgi:hypothetical protein
MSDAVNKPEHYNQGQIECIDAMKIVLTPEEFRGYLKGNVFKYLWREKDKNGNEDLRKGKSYYDWLIELIDESEKQKAADLQSLKDHPFGKLKEATLNSDTIPEGYRKLNDSSEEPRQIGDLRWSVAEKRYIEISVDEIGYANRDNWAACRKITGEVTGQVTGEVKPPDGCRWLEVGEVIRKGDQGFEKGLLYSIEPMKIGMTLQAHWMPTIRRNRFEVGEKVVDFCGQVWEVEYIFDTGNRYRLKHKEVHDERYGNSLAPYIEETK